MSSLTNAGSAHSPLDAQLFGLSAGEAVGSRMPLAISRFTAEFGAEKPTTAIKLSTDMLLEGCVRLYGDIKAPLSVERLCTVCNAELAGFRPSARSRSSYASEGRSRVGHTGRLYLRDSRIIITIPEEIDFETARLSVAHEIGHVLIHQRGSTYDEATMRLSSSVEEEALAEYAARLLLLPGSFFCVPPGVNLAQFAVERAGSAKTTVHSAVSRLGDPDILPLGAKGAILWRMNSNVPNTDPICNRLTPQWHLCPGAFVPLKRCRARAGSLIADLADMPSAIHGSAIETVNIGTFTGTFRVDAFAWGSVSQGTRLVLSVFCEPREA